MAQRVETMDLLDGKMSQWKHKKKKKNSKGHVAQYKLLDLMDGLISWTANMARKEYGRESVAIKWRSKVINFKLGRRMMFTMINAEFEGPHISYSL